ncbi:type II and III secretion system protein family protein [Roseomonas sp. BN140053]|uniref:type II and III secretion system protein family protein n=1 Tax=Roseomonas sp. BN140053 TaxID=3391898 RepID=UPI0039EA82DE
MIPCRGRQNAAALSPRFGTPGVLQGGLLALLLLGGVPARAQQPQDAEPVTVLPPLPPLPGASRAPLLLPLSSALPPASGRAAPARGGDLRLLDGMAARPPVLRDADALPEPRITSAAAEAPLQRLLLEAGQGRLISLPGAAASLFAADPRVAELRPASPSTVFVLGTGPGRTTLAAIDEAGRPLAQWEVTVRVSTALMGELQNTLRRGFPGGNLRVDAGTTGVVLTGDVSTAAEAERAVALLRTRLDEKMPVENRLSVIGSTQVNLRVRIAEVNREVTRQLGINWSALGGVGRIGTALAVAGAGPAGIAFATQNSALDLTSPADLFGVGIRTGAQGLRDINAVIDALAQDRLITILAEPNLTAQTGETASFLAGGEFPIPVSQRDNQVSIEFKQFGVSLAFVPTVLGEGRIALRVRPEVSELSDTGAVRLLSGNNNTVTIPSLSVRRAETTVELGSGQSFAIAGLLQDNSRQTGRGLPFLGEVPVLGALFRSDRYQRNETELVIIVTPYLVRPTGGPRALAAPTDGYVPPNDVERILLLRQTGRGRPAPPHLPGNVGFVLD